MTFFVCRMLVGSSFLTLALSMALAQNVKEPMVGSFFEADLHSSVIALA
ncbi:MAG: hypothetical protein R2880_16805 [Deinococcales bacterium]